MNAHSDGDFLHLLDDPVYDLVEPDVGAAYWAVLALLPIVMAGFLLACWTAR